MYREENLKGGEIGGNSNPSTSTALIKLEKQRGSVMGETHFSRYARLQRKTTKRARTKQEAEDIASDRTTTSKFP